MSVRFGVIFLNVQFFFFIFWYIYIQ